MAPQARERDDLRSNFWRRKLRPAILARDNWTCHICGQPIDPRYKSPHALSASVDHVQGASTGFDQRFLKAAHLGCNVKRGDPLRVSDPTPKAMTRWGDEPRIMQPSGLPALVAATAERSLGHLIGVARMRHVLDAACRVLAGELPAWRVQDIHNAAGQLYMRRHFIGSSNDKPHVWVHEILLSDNDRWLHDHPWDYKTVLLSGGYDEETQAGTADYAEGSALSRSAEDLHRLHLTSPVVTLFATGQRKRDWGFSTPDGWVEASSYLERAKPKAMTRW